MDDNSKRMVLDVSAIMFKGLFEHKSEYLSNEEMFHNDLMSYIEKEGLSYEEFFKRLFPATYDKIMNGEDL